MQLRPVSTRSGFLFRTIMPLGFLVLFLPKQSFGQG